MVIALCLVAQGELLADGMLFLLLVQREDRLWREILIHLHVIVQVLIASGTGEMYLLIAIGQREILTEHRAAIGAGVIDVDWVDLSIVYMVCAGKESVRETALIDIIATESVGRLEMRIESALNLETSAYIVLLVYLLPVMGIGEETIVMLIIGGCRKADLLA